MPEVSRRWHCKAGGTISGMTMMMNVFSGIDAWPDGSVDGSRLGSVRVSVDR
jgi:hypothetical protein